MRLLLFDVDGTLLSAKGAGRRALEGTLQAHYGLSDGLRNVPLDGKTDPMIVREALEGTGHYFPGLDADFISTYLDLLRQELARCQGFAVLQGVVDLMSELRRDRRLLIGLATGNIREGAWIKVRHAGLGQHFEFGGYGCDSEDRTEVIRTAMRRGTVLAREPVEDAVVIGDTPRDIEHGKRAGARVVAVASGSYSSQRLRRHDPDLMVESLQPCSEVLQFLKPPDRNGLPGSEGAISF